MRLVSSYWNCLARHEGDETKACEDVKLKYLDDFARTKDLHLFCSVELLQLHHHELTGIIRS